MTASVGWVSLNDATAQKFPTVQSPAGMVAVHGDSFVRADRLVMWYDVGGSLCQCVGLLTLDFMYLKYMCKFDYAYFSSKIGMVLMSKGEIGGLSCM